jgi:Flp pilus assembly protein TadG
MKTMKRRINRFLNQWIDDRDGVAAVEAALIFPILLTLMLGTFDIGNGILANQKTIRASQIVADLITRQRTVSEADIDEAVDGGRLAFETISSDTYGVDIVSIRFDEDGDPEIAWRETRGMSPKADVLEAVESLSEPNGGVVVVSVEYLFEPVFAGFVVDAIPMQEIAFARGRKSAVVSRE